MLFDAVIIPDKGLSILPENEIRTAKNYHKNNGK